MVTVHTFTDIPTTTLPPTIHAQTASTHLSYVSLVFFRPHYTTTNFTLIVPFPKNRSGTHTHNNQPPRLWPSLSMSLIFLVICVSLRPFFFRLSCFLFPVVLAPFGGGVVTAAEGESTHDNKHTYNRTHLESPINDLSAHTSRL